MEAKDLRTAPPRRWNEQLDGIYWLPRLIDKTRAALAGTLGAYLFGQSPVDRGLLRALGMSHREFAALVMKTGEDAGVLIALAERDAQALVRARAWSSGLPHRNRMFLQLLDIDDGYRKDTWLRVPVQAAANAISFTVKHLMPSRAAERAVATEE